MAGRSTISKLPATVSGTTRKLTHGTASRLASGPINEPWPKNQMVIGNKARLSTSCTRGNSRHSTCFVPIGRVTASRMATPAKDNQKPAESTASGSQMTMTVAARASACATELARRA